ncbi:MAG: beta-propeller fold lactonase family protein [Candidatus Adiutrix sp.]|jgi:DNA-binding beta-propeller fold protein YncE|nr:beta-propeller fold lactonase family protein [Candidatus Adiutrix sp.]
MGGGGITFFSVPDGKLLGALTAFCPTPRHLVIDTQGQYLYASNNREGVVSRVPMAGIMEDLDRANGKTLKNIKGDTLRVGSGARTIALSPDGNNLYVAVNNAAQLVQVDLKEWRVVRSVSVSPYPVGLDVSPDGMYVAVTSQGKGDGHGGNSVEIFRTTP